MFTSPCLNSAILAKYPSSTPRGEPLRLTKRTDDLLLHTHVVVKDAGVQLMFSRCCFAENGTELFQSACHYSYLSDIGPIKFFICGIVTMVAVVDSKAP